MADSPSGQPAANEVAVQINALRSRIAATPVEDRTGLRRLAVALLMVDEGRDDPKFTISRFMAGLRSGARRK